MVLFVQNLDSPTNIVHTDVVETCELLLNGFKNQLPS